MQKGRCWAGAPLATMSSSTTATQCGSGPQSRKCAERLQRKFSLALTDWQKAAAADSEAARALTTAFGALVT